MSGTEEVGSKPGDCLASHPVHRGRVVDLSIDRVRFPDGSLGELEMIRHSGAAAILPLFGNPADTDPDLLLIRQYRYATGGYLYEVPAGRPDREGEPWEECARRELEEETGLRAGKLLRLTTIYTTPGFTDERIHLFLATELSEGSTSFDPDEFVEPVRIPVSRALEMIRSGEISDAKTICTIGYFQAFVRGP
ncbi:MAG: NUDIX hydrolase [Longimicrobiaceae bacterium]